MFKLDNPNNLSIIDDVNMLIEKDIRDGKYGQFILPMEYLQMSKDREEFEERFNFLLKNKNKRKIIIKNEKKLYNTISFYKK